jgi:hypothetical protein
MPISPLTSPVFPIPLDNISSTLSASYSPGSGSLTVANGNPFGSPSTSAPLRVTAQRAADMVRVHFLVTGVTGNVLTIESVIDGYIDISLDIGDKVGVLVSAGTILDLQSVATQSVSTINSLITSDAAKALDSSVVHLSGGVSETITGSKTFTQIISGNISGNAATSTTAGAVSTIAGLVSAGTNVTLTGSGTSSSPYSIAASGGGGSPGGSTGQIQYNNSGAFAGTAALTTSSTIPLSINAPSGLSGNILEVIDPSSNLGLYLSSTGALTVSGGINEDTTNKGITLGYGDSPRVLFCNGTSAQNWQIDTYGAGALFRWFIPGIVEMSLSNYGVLTVATVSTSQMIVQQNPSTTADLAAFKLASGTTVSGVRYDGTIYLLSGTTSERPTSVNASIPVGSTYFDTTLGIPIWFEGSAWVNSAGATV